MASSSKSLNEYLKRYDVNNEEEEKRKRKNKKQKTKAEPVGVLVVDEDPVWQKAVNVEEDNGDNSLDEDKPVVGEDIEIKRMKRLQQLRARRPLNSISEDGSGWVTVGDSPPKLSNSEPMSPEYSREDADLSPPRQGRKHLPPPPGSDLSPTPLLLVSHCIRPGRHWDGVDRSNGRFSFTLWHDTPRENMCTIISDCVTQDLRRECSEGRMRNKLRRRKLIFGLWQICA